MTRSLLLVAAALVAGGDLVAQAVPDSSQAARVSTAYRRTPTLRVDPFRHVMIPHWGLVVSGGALGANNTLNIKDVRALIFLGDRDSLLIGDIVNTFGLVPVGQGVRGEAEGEGGVHIGGPFGRHVSFGISAQGRGYGAFLVDDRAVALLRDGNAAQQQFFVGDTKGSVLAAAEFGAHGVIRVGPIGTIDGAELSIGFGGRYIRPLFYARARSLIEDSRVLLTGDTIAANVRVESLHTEDIEFGRGTGIAADFLVRLEWPTNGFSLEAMVANLGKVTMDGLRRDTLSFNVNTTDLQEVSDSLEVLEFFEVQALVNDVKVTLPRIVRFSASGWANAILQLDVSATMPVSGEFDTPLAVDVGTTWRFLRQVPLRAGLVLGGRQGFGFTGGLGLETRNFFVVLAGGSLGGLFGNATGVAGRLELGFFF
ncbi:MAG: hypothetical protein GTN78_20740 [Gemmatimonadales bacterium]|nr:hypothetical protein [Gemmatimonadales bacterium]NIN10111.1 hypothetical protein [Gemmatimonadales bacterium]NIR02595.1 hypothetical protein [Gemmatimonadales bacterium]NIS66289.1 hypothetical protein [Gemmatimonadales bacterium]